MIQPSTSKPLHPHGQNIPLQGFKISIAHILPFANEVYDIICVGAAQRAARRPQFAVSRRGDLWFTNSLSGLSGHLSWQEGLTIRKDVFVLLLYIIKWLYAWILPMGGIVLALILLLCYMFRKHSPGRWALAAVTAVFYLLSIEPVSNGLIHPLETAYDQPQGADVDGDVIVLLGGGSRAGVPDFDGTGQVGSAAANRFLMALRLQKAKDLPILLSGGTILKGDANESEIEKRMLLSLGVPENKIFMDDKSRNTAENAAFSKQICEHQGWKKPILVTSAFHMPRSVRFFTREGLDVTPYPCDYHTSAATNWSGYSIVPQSFYLFNSCLAIKEYVGIGAASLRMQ